MELNFLHLKKFILTSFFTYLLLSACEPKDSYPSEAVLPPTKIIATQYLASISPSTNAPQHQTLDEVLGNKSYLQDCKIKYPPVYNHQIGFLEILPGITKVNDLTSQLGNSYQYTKTDEEEGYDYYNVDALFVVKNKMVESIILGESHTEMLLPLRTLLEKYGCPDVINALALTDDSFETSIKFNKTIFWYVYAGIWIRFESYPISYSDTSSQISFEAPPFIHSIIGFDEHSKPVSFSEAITDK